VIDNINRYFRLERLHGDVVEYWTDTIDYATKIKTDSPYWDYIFDEYAKIVGYSNSDDLVEDANFWALQANSSFKGGQDAYSDIEDAKGDTRMGQKISSIIGSTSFMGTAGLRVYMKVKYKADLSKLCPPLLISYPNRWGLNGLGKCGWKAN